MRRIKTLAEFEALTKDADILEKETAGVKVLRLPEERIMKLFRRKRLLSSQIWAPHAWRFSRNARVLKKRGIATVTIETHFEVPEIKRQGVIYKRLEGRTLRDWMAKTTVTDHPQMMSKVGAFVAQIHAVGILFRSLHFENILVMKNQELALIDIVDMTFHWFGPLTIQERIRNFHHMDRYDADRYALAATENEGFIESYLNACELNKREKMHLLKSFNSIFASIPQVKDV